MPLDHGSLRSSSRHQAAGMGLRPRCPPAKPIVLGTDAGASDKLRGLVLPVTKILLLVALVVSGSTLMVCCLAIVSG